MYKKIMIQREEDFTALIQEISCKTTQEAKTSKLQASSSSTTSAATSWSRLKDPRIVRVSRVFGGKDRHSKVCTAKGLRDRRVRLSVPTAIQLYDLQERLGLNQPSKVVDWLLNAAKDEIDGLPPLQNIPYGLSFSKNDSSKQQRSSPFWEKPMEVSGETSVRDHHENWSKNHEDEHQYVNASFFLASRQNPTPFSGYLDSTISPHNPFSRRDPSNISLSQPTQSHSLSTVRANDQDLHIFSHFPVSSTLPFAYEPRSATQSGHFSSQITAMNTEFNPKRLSTSSLSSPVNSSYDHTVRPFHFSMTANLLSSQNNEANEQSDRFRDSRS